MTLQIAARSWGPLLILALTLLAVSLVVACGGGSDAKLDQSLTSLKVGDCVDGGDEGNVTGITTVDCSKQGALAVIKIFDMSDAATFPGSDAVSAAASASDGCPQTTVQDIGPTKDSWEKAHDRQVICLATITSIDVSPSPT